MSRQLLVRVLRVAALAAMLAAAWPAAHAQNVTWTGTSSTLWSNTLNWSTLALPSANASLSFTGGGGISNNNIGSGTYRSLTFLSALSAPLTLTGSSLTLSATAAGNTTINNLYTGGTVTIQNDLVLSNNQVWQNTSASGPNSVTIISGNVSGPGAPVVTTNNTASTNNFGVLVLAGTNNNWTGEPTQSVNSLWYNSGSGGLMVRAGFVRFQGDASLPRGASGTSYISAQGGQFNSIPAGILLTGSAAEAVYDLPSNYRFLLVASATNAGAGSVRFGADGGKARVQDSSMLLNMSGSTMAMQAAQLLVRPGSELTLGASGLAFNLIPTFGSSANATTATPYATTTDVAATRTLDKTGAGTLVLDNVKYTDLALSGTTNSQFRWQISEGAVRGRAMNNTTPASSSNSLQGFFITMAGGVYEIDSSGSTSTLTATLGTSLVSGSTILNMNNASGGGFSAFNGAATVTLNGGALLAWNSGFTPGFLQNNQPLIFGSETATDVVTFTNNVATNGNTREIRVLDNTASTTDYAVMSGVLSESANINKTGPGILRLSATNTYTGVTTISAGVLEATTLANAGSNSSLGAPTAASGTVVLGSATTSATLRYVGSGAASTNRSFNLAGNGGIEANGGGALAISGGVSGAGSQVFTLSGTNTGDNSIGAISGAGVSVVKNGSGRWVLSGSSTFGGPLAINEGTLVVGATNAINPASPITIGSASSRGNLLVLNPQTISSLTFTGLGGDLPHESGIDPVTFLNTTTGTATINVLSGSNTFHPNAIFSSNTVVDIAAGAFLNFHTNLTSNADKSLTKTGSGTLGIVGDNDAFAGSFFINGGRVNIGGGMTQLGTGTTFLSNGSILDLGGRDFMDRIVSNGGTILNAGGTAATTTINAPTTIGGTSSVLGTFNITSTGSARFEAVVGNGSSLADVVVNTGTGSGGQAFFAAAVSESAYVTVNNGGTATFADTMSGNVISHGQSTFNGNVNGEVNVQAGGSSTFVGSTGTASNVTVAPTGWAEFRGNVAGELTVNGTAAFTNTASVSHPFAVNAGGLATLNDTDWNTNGKVDVDGALRITRSSGTQTIGSVIAGTGSLTKLGAGVLALTADNTFTGVTTVSEGTLSIGNGGAAGSLAGDVVNNASLVFNRSGALTYANIISGSGSVTKLGTGRVTLTGVNTYTGPTTISAGVFEVGSTGRVAAGSGVTINGGEFKYNADAALSSPITFTQGTISGTGAIGSAVTVGANAIISPGNSPGIQPYTNGLTFAPGGTYQWEINALAGTVGTNWDAVNVTGPLSLSGLLPSSKFNLDLITLTGSNTPGPLASPYDGGSYVFPIALYSSTSSLTVPGGFSNAAGSDLTSLFNIILTSWQGTKPNPADISVKVNDTGTGLNLIVVPEPATIALAGIAAACAGVMAWRRRRPTT